MAISLLIQANASFAHPHSWIDTETQIIGTTDTITGFDMRWTFDPLSTAYLIDGEDLSEKNRLMTLKLLAEDVMNNMAKSHYFTYITRGKNKAILDLSPVENQQLRLEKGKAILNFRLRLLTPYHFNQGPMTIRIFDPSYYVDMSWPNTSSLTLSTSLKSRCRLAITAPNPTSAQLSYAMAIPKDATPDNTLGQLFTQSGTITCHSLNTTTP